MLCHIVSSVVFYYFINFFSSQTGSIILQYLSVLQHGQMHQIWKTQTLRL